MIYSIINTTPRAAIAQLPVEALLEKYATRYREFRQDSHASAAVALARYSQELFAPPDGAFIVVVRDGETVSGGAFKRCDAVTAELNWTRADLHRHGLASRMVGDLATRALRQGYRRIYLTKGFKQPEAWGLYLDARYAPLFDRANLPKIDVHRPFAKDLKAPSCIDSLEDSHTPEPLGSHLPE